MECAGGFGSRMRRGTAETPDTTETPETTEREYLLFTVRIHSQGYARNSNQKRRGEDDALLRGFFGKQIVAAVRKLVWTRTVRKLVWLLG